MPNPTKQDRELALASRGTYTASQVRGWRDQGYGPASQEPLTRDELVAYFTALAPLMGKGRDGDAAVLKLAAEGRPDRRLREVLLKLQEPPVWQWSGMTLDADSIVNAFVDEPELANLLGIFTARDAPPFWESEDVSAPETNEVQRTFVLPLAQVIAREEVEPADLIDMGSITDQMAARHLGTLGPGLPDLPDYETAATEGKPLLTLIAAAVKAGNGAREWIERANLTELAQAVKVAAPLVDMMSGLWTIRDEERWKIAGRIAPLAWAMRLLFAVVSRPALMVDPQAIGQIMPPEQAKVLAPLVDGLRELIGALGDSGQNPTLPAPPPGG